MSAVSMLTNVRRRDALIIGLACAGILVYVLVAIHGSGVGFALDDAWIHQTYGRNLAQSGQWAFVPGVPSAGSTSPLYTVLLAVGYVLRAPYFIWTYALGMAALSAIGLIGARLAEQLFPQLPNVGLFAGLLLVATWHLIWAAASGMETALFGALSLAVIGLAWRELTDVRSDSGAAFGRGLVFGIVGALLTLTRPEGAGLVALCGLLMLIARPQKTWRAFDGWAVGAVLSWLIVILPDALLNYSLNGSILPNTSAAKQAELIGLLAPPLWTRIGNMLYPLSAGGQLIVIPGALYAAFELIQRARTDRRALLFWLPLLWVITVVFVYAIRLPAPFQHGRYMMSTLPPFIVFGAAGTLAYVARVRRWQTWRIVAQVLLLSVVLVFAAFWPIGATIYSQDVSEINGEMVTAAHWINANVPSNALFALHDIGAVGYFAPRPLFDLAGLVSPEVVPIILNSPALMTMMQTRGAQYLMESHAQLLVPADDPRLCPLYTTPGPESPIHMTVYRFAWNGKCAP